MKVNGDFENQPPHRYTISSSEFRSTVELSFRDGKFSRDRIDASNSGRRDKTSNMNNTINFFSYNSKYGFERIENGI